MDVTTELSSLGIVIRISGQLTFKDQEKWHKVFTEAFDRVPGGCCYFDLSALEFIDSAGIGMFLIALEEAKKTDINVVLSCPQGQVQKILEISKMSSLFKIDDKPC